jgi:PAS domain-containing protein
MATSFFSLRKYEELGRYELSDTTWIISQTKIDYHRLLSALDRYAFGIGEVSKDQLNIRFDAFWSRLPLYLHGKEGRKFQAVPGVWETMQRSLDVLSEVDPLVRALEPGDVAAYEPIREALETLDRPLNQVIVDVLVHDEGDTIFRNERLEGVQVQLFVAAFGTMLAGGLLVVMLVIEGRNSRLAQGAAQEARTQLVEAIGSISEGFVLHDADDRLVLCNQRFAEMLAPPGDERVAHYLKPGARYEELIRASVA